MRERVLNAHDSGMARDAIIRLFHVSQGSITRWARRHRTTGDFTPQRPSGRPSVIPPDQQHLLRLQLEADPDAALATHAAQWNADHGTTLSSWTMARAIRRLGWSRKKNRSRQRTRYSSPKSFLNEKSGGLGAQPPKNPPSFLDFWEDCYSWTRAMFALEQADLDAAQIVVIDEVGSNLDMTPTHAWAPIDERALAAVPPGTPMNTTTIASMTAQGMGPSMIVTGGVDRITFTTYLEQVLAPTLRAGQFVLLDNLSAHTSTRAQEIVAAAGARLVYLPPYSPDYAPIELAFSQLKADLRRAAARTRSALEQAIATALRQISAADARAFFLHFGYRFAPNLDQWFCT